MNLKRVAKISLLSIVLAMQSFILPVAFADLDISYDSETTSSDEAQGDISAADCANLSESLAAASGCSSSSASIDGFSGFDGTMEAPDAAAYDPALTKVTSGRELIQTIVNFALSFLGLISTVVVIYGGVLYVTSRGDETQAGEGKKAISYAVVGIVIILSSFAIVNTLLSATGADTSGDGTTGTTIAESGAAFDVTSVLEELTNITSEYLDAYKTYNKVVEEVAYMGSINAPVQVEVTDTDISVGGALEFIGEFITGADTDYSDIYSYVDQSEIDSYLDKLNAGIVKIQGTVDTSVSCTYESSQALKNYLKSGSTTSLVLPDMHFVKTAHAETVLEGQFDVTEDMISDEEANETANAGTGDCYYSVAYSGDENISDNWNVDPGSSGLTFFEIDVSEIDGTIKDRVADIGENAAEDYTRTVEDLAERLSDLNELFDDGDAATSTLQTINDAFTTLNTQITDAEDVDNISAVSVSSFIKSIDKIYKLVQNVQFVDARIAASVTTGNAPLIVRFDSLGTLDPKMGTVDDENISWDFGDLNASSDSPNTSTGPATSHKFENAGTYRVKMKASSSDPDYDIAAGIAYVTIKVSPRSSIIKLQATAGGESTELADFSVFPAIDKSTYKVILNEAKAGIQFSAEGSTGGGGEDDELSFYSWDFGDGEIVEGPTEVTPDLHMYGEEGTYTMSLTVTDATGLKDRKYTKIYVGSPAARISVSPESGMVGTKFEFSGAASSANLGTISNYKWAATLDGTPYALENDNGIEINTEFDQPGIYTMSLTVTDGVSGTDTDSIDVLVESQSPVAKFDYSVPNSTKPGTYIFDGSKSYDPDEKDTLTYAWAIGGEEGEDWSVESQETDGSAITINFLTTGERDISLSVSDNHESELQKTSVAEVTIDVSSVLDVDLDVGDGTYKLGESAEVEAEMTATSENASEVDIDYGDGESDLSTTFSSGKETFKHTYKQAGVFNVKLTALADDNSTNSITRRIYVGTGDSPIAVMNVTADGNDTGFGDSISGNIKTKFEFDATSSINTDGSSKNLSYSWNFDDQTTSSSSKVSHIFDETGDFDVVLTVKDSKDPTLSSQSNIKVTIEDVAPEISGITAVPVSSSLITPLTVNINVDASDVDGKIVKVNGWYYDVNNSSVALGEASFATTSFSLKVNTNGLEDEEITYGFAAEVYDNQNNKVSTAESLAESKIPTITVKNGPNASPTVGFGVDQTSVFVGDEINFTSTSKDSDGTIIAYTWDLEGDGFSDNESEEEPKLTYIFTESHPLGIDVKLKVEDDAGATAVSDSIKIYVTSNSAPPEAAFLTEITGKTVKFSDNTVFDSDNGAAFSGIYWDFDTSVDVNGDGVKDNDVEDKDKESPSHTYETLGTYNVKMTIVDNTGQTDTVTNAVKVIQTVDPKAGFSSVVSDKLVTFTDSSTTDTANDITVKSYKWDFDTSKDSDGDTVPDNDSDATTKNPSHTYDAYGIYEAKLTITDTYKKESSAENTVSLVAPIEPIVISFTSLPAAVSKKVTMTGENGYVTFYFSATGGSGDFSYQIDKNIFYDTSGDGERANDIDDAQSKSGSWETYFDKSYGQTVVKLSVTDNETGESAYDTIQITFQGSTGGANLFNATNSELYLFILGAFMAAIAGTALAYTSKPQS